MRRYASFIGTSNQKDLLTDPSGSRRFICIEVTAPINTNVTINYRQLYAQAMEAIYKGERYWLDDEDEQILKTDEPVNLSRRVLWNSCFIVISVLQRRGEGANG